MTRDPRGGQARMSSYAVFLRESNQLLSTVTDEFLEEKRFPIAVPHSRPRGTWGEWMKEITIPKEVLDSLVRRYDSTSWSATGGKSSTAANDDDARTVPAAGAWRRKPVLPQEPRDVSKEGGAMRGVCGAAAARSRPKSSGRARALRLRSESSLEYQRPGQVRVFRRISSVMTHKYGSLPWRNFVQTSCVALATQLI